MIRIFQFYKLNQTVPKIIWKQSAFDLSSTNGLSTIDVSSSDLPNGIPSILL